MNETSLETPPVYCYVGQQTEVAKFCRRTFMMSPLHAVSKVEQIRGEKPTLIYVRGHYNPVPGGWWAYLAALGVRYVVLS